MVREDQKTACSGIPGWAVFVEGSDPSGQESSIILYYLAIDDQRSTIDDSETELFGLRGV